MPTTTFEPLATATATGSQNLISLTNLGGYKHLVLECVFGTAGGGGALFTINGSNINSIRHDMFYTYSGGSAPNELVNDYTGYTYINPGGNMAAGHQGMTRLYIFNANSSTYKPYYVETSWQSSFNHAYGFGTCHDTNPITQLSIQCGVNFTSGSKFTVFGLAG
jgi:hypothetical protein